MFSPKNYRFGPNEYKHVTCIGSGGLAKVYKYVNISDDSDIIAVKVFTPDWTKDARSVAEGICRVLSRLITAIIVLLTINI